MAYDSNSDVPIIRAQSDRLESGSKLIRIANQL